MSTVQVTFQQFRGSSGTTSGTPGSDSSRWRPSSGACWNDHYSRYELAFFDGGRILLILDGQPQQIVDSESDRWESLADAGRTDSRSGQEYDEIGYEGVRANALDTVGEEGARLLMQLKPVVTRTSLDPDLNTSASYPRASDETSTIHGTNRRRKARQFRIARHRRDCRPRARGWLRRT